MGVWISVLLCLGFCLGVSRMGTREEKLHKPSLWVMPSPSIPVGSPVRIGCRGPPGARLYYLEKAGRPESLREARQPWPRNEVVFLISGVTPLHAGPYRCSYRLLASWSELSDALELVVTGAAQRGPPWLRKLDTSTPLESHTAAELGPVLWTGATVEGATSGPETTAGRALRDSTVSNLLRMGLAGLVLAALGVLLAWPGRRTKGAPAARTLSLSQF